MRTQVVVAALLIGGWCASEIASAQPKAKAKPKPLPAGMKVVLKLGRPYIQQGTVTVALRDDDLADYEKVAKAELAEDGKTIVVTATRCKGTLADDVTKVPLIKVQARVDNALGLVAHGKKRYAEAITKFTSATQKDPEAPSYATNLLAAQLLGKKVELAGQTIAMQGRKNPAWFAWRMALDPDLAGAKTHKRTKDLVAATLGTATVEKLGDHDLALSDVGPGMAALRTLAVGSPGTTDLDIISLSTGKLLARLPLVALEDACEEDSPDHPCDDAAKARIAERVKTANGVLALLGFKHIAKAFVDVRNGDPVTKDGVTIETSDHQLTATRGADEKVLEHEGSAWMVAVTPKALVVKLNLRNLYACDDGSSRFTGTALPL